MKNNSIAMATVVPNLALPCRNSCLHLTNLLPNLHFTDRPLRSQKGFQCCRSFQSGLRSRSCSLNQQGYGRSCKLHGNSVLDTEIDELITLLRTVLWNFSMYLIQNYYLYKPISRVTERSIDIWIPSFNCYNR